MKAKTNLRAGVVVINGTQTQTASGTGGAGGAGTGSTGGVGIGGAGGNSGITNS
jgi:hypothetical protein